MTDPDPPTDLRGLALLADPGPWHVTTCLDYWVESAAGVGDHEWPEPSVHQRQWEANARYIAAADPQTVIGLLDEIERLKAEHDAATSEIGRLRTIVRVNLLRWVPGATHGEIDRILDGHQPI